MVWYNSSWANAVQITVVHAQVGANQTNFPCYVDLSILPAGFFTGVRTDGGDIRITQSDGTTEVAREIVAINTTSKTGEVHFNAPSLSSTADTSFYIYFNNPSATAYAANATYGKYNVWDSNYKSVYHFNGNSNDSTSNQNNGTDTSVTYGASYAKLNGGQGANFNGTSSKITRTYANIGTTISVDTWFNLASLTTTEAYISFMSTLFQAASGATPLYYYPDTSGGSNGPSTSPTVNLSTFYHWAITITGTTQNFYFNGAQQGTANTTATNSVNTVNNSTETIGAWGSGRYWSGSLDELRISSVTRALSWYSTQYNNQNSPSTFYTVGTVLKNVSGGGIMAFFMK